MINLSVILFIGLFINHAQADTRVVGGANAPDSKFPYVAMVHDKNGYLCGGSIINKKYVLTAAHCVYTSEAKNIEIIVGTKKFSGEGGRKYSAKTIVVHEDHQRMKEGYSVNDIAVIELNDEIEFNDKVQPVKLPELNGEVSEKTKVTLVGFGKTEDGGSNPEFLQYVENQIFNQPECKLWWFSFQLIILDEKMICTKGVKGIGACLGDSGSPLVTDDDIQLGIVSFGYPCGYGSPDVYTNLPLFVDWLGQFLTV